MNTNNFVFQPTQLNFNFLNFNNQIVIGQNKNNYIVDSYCYDSLNNSQECRKDKNTISESKKPKMIKKVKEENNKLTKKNLIKQKKLVLTKKQLETRINEWLNEDQDDVNPIEINFYRS